MGGLLLAARNLKTVWQGSRRWPARTWSIVLVVAAAAALWLAVVCRLTSLGTQF